MDRYRGAPLFVHAESLSPPTYNRLRPLFLRGRRRKRLAEWGQAMQGRVFRTLTTLPKGIERSSLEAEVGAPGELDIQLVKCPVVRTCENGGYARIDSLWNKPPCSPLD